MSFFWALMCAGLLVWVLVLQARLRQQRRAFRVAIAATRHWRQRALRPRHGGAVAAVPVVLSQHRKSSRVERNRGRRALR